MKHTLPLLILSLGLSGSAFAQNAPAKMAPTNKQPIEITATKTVEWLRNDKKYIARENVIVTQGSMSMHSDLLTADYTESKESSMQISVITSEGNVQIINAQNTAYGDKGVYDVAKGIATLTGKDLRIISPDQTVTATDRMEYYANTREAKAIGNAKVVRGTDILTADTITAVFKDNAAKAAETKTGAVKAPTAPVPAKDTAKSGDPLGGGNLERLEAEGNVVIKTPSETLRGAKGIYHSDTNTAELTGKVKIERGENVLEGDRAEVNLTTNVSKMFGSDKPGSRVRGVFFPGADTGTPKPKKGAPVAKTATPPKSLPKADEAKIDGEAPKADVLAKPETKKTVVE